MIRHFFEDGRLTLAIDKRLGGVGLSGEGLSLAFGCDMSYVTPGRANAHRFGAENWKHISREIVRDVKGSPETALRVVDVFEGRIAALSRQVEAYKGPGAAMRMRVCAINRGQQALEIRQLMPLATGREGQLALGDKAVGDWVFYRSGRHKNDMPDCFCPRARGGFDSGAQALTEHGGQAEGAACGEDARVESDELSVIRASAELDAMGAVFGFLSPQAHLVDFAIEADGMDAKRARVEAICQADGVMLEEGQSLMSDWLYIDAGRAPFEAVERYADRCGAVREGRKKPSVYSTWYFYADTIREEDALENIAAIRESGLPVDVFQIDDGWQIGYGQWQENERFPSGMRALAHRIAAAGMTPGIWTCPFIVETDGPIAREKEHWLLCHSDGRRCVFHMVGKDYLVLDVTHPEVLDWLRALYRDLTHRVGYKYHKLDFTRACVQGEDLVYHDRSLTRAQAYRKGLQAVREGAGEGAYIVVCGGLYGPSFGIADAQRTGADVRSRWPASGPPTVKQNVLRFYQGQLWHNDPDALMIRRRGEPFRGLEISLGSLTDEQALLMAINQYVSGGIVSFSEKIADTDGDRLALLRHILPPIGEPATPRDLFEGGAVPCVLDTRICPTIEGLGQWHTVALVNWSDEWVKRDVRLDRALVGAFAEGKRSYVVSEFFSGDVYEGVAAGDLIEAAWLPPMSAKVYRIAVQERESAQLVYADGHFSMGGVHIARFEQAGARLELRVDWPFSEPMRLKIRAAEGMRWEGAKGARPELLEAQIDGPGAHEMAFCMREAGSGPQ